MTDVATKNDFILVKDGSVLLGCGCCSPCCCTGNAPPLASTLQDFESPSVRRILNPATATCTGRRITVGKAGLNAEGTDNGCAGISVVVEWCGLTIEKLRNNTFATANRPINQVYGDYLYRTASMSFESPPSFFTETGPFITRCGRCWFRLALQVRISRRLASIFLFSTISKRYLLDWRDGCDASANITLTDFNDGNDNIGDPPPTGVAFETCDEPPTIMVVMAP